MTEDKHAPWHLEDGANSHVFDGRVVDPDGVTVAFVTLGSQSASLIAAAPELLAALYQAQIALGEYACHIGDKSPCRRSGDQCQSECGKIAGDAALLVDSAIAKATGAS